MPHTTFTYRASRSLTPSQRKSFERAVENEFPGKYTISWTDNHEPIFETTAQNHSTPNELDHFVAGFYHSVHIKG